MIRLPKNHIQDALLPKTSAYRTLKSSVLEFKVFKEELIRSPNTCLLVRYSGHLMSSEYPTSSMVFKYHLDCATFNDWITLGHFNND